MNRALDRPSFLDTLHDDVVYALHDIPQFTNASRRPLATLSRATHRNVASLGVRFACCYEYSSLEPRRRVRGGGGRSVMASTMDV